MNKYFKKPKAQESRCLLPLVTRRLGYFGGADSKEVWAHGLCFVCAVGDLTHGAAEALQQPPQIPSPNPDLPLTLSSGVRGNES